MALLHAVAAGVVILAFLLPLISVFVLLPLACRDFYAHWNALEPWGMGALVAAIPLFAVGGLVFIVTGGR